MRCCISLAFVFGAILCSTAQAQSLSVSGRIVDETNQPVIGAGILEKGSNNGTVSDLDGQFTIMTKADATLVFSSLGYDSQEVAVNGRSVINVVLSSNTEFLDDVVVIGYGVQKKKLITGSTIQVKGDDLVKLNNTSALGALQSSTPGVSIIANTGQPGDGYNVNIRGMGTIGSYKPLYVIDGVAGGDISDLNPSDIESIDILKDAASAAIYGARAANGVILVTTKQGKEGNIQVSYDGYVGWQNSPVIPEVLNAKQYIEVINLGQKNSGLTPTNFQELLSPELYNSIMNGSFTGTNWIKEFHNDNAPVTNHSINIAGGSDRSKFSMGVSYTGQEGIFGKPAASNYKRATVRLNSDHVIYRKNNLDIISVGENFNFTYSEKSGINLSNQYSNNMFDALTANPLAPMRRADGEFTNADDYTAFGIFKFDGDAKNPMYVISRTSQGNNWRSNYALNMSANLRIQPIKDLIVRSQFNYKMSANSRRSYNMTYEANSTSFLDIDKVTQNASLGWSWSWENTASYKFNFGKNNFDAMVGMSIEHSGYGESVGAGREGGKWIDDPTHAYVSNMTGQLLESSITGSPWSDSGLISYFGRINYDYAEKYMVSLILRRDGSSNFAPGHRWGTFPSISAGWVMTNEPWMSDVKNVLSFLKLRGSWGQNGNCAIDNFQYLATVQVGPDDGRYGFANGITDQLSNGSYADKLANPDVSWETSQQLDLGLDARFFRSRLGLTFDWYQKDTKNWLVKAPIMGHYGADAPYINGGDVRNSGVELALTWSDQVNDDFYYSIGVNGAYNKNIVTRIANGEGVIHGSAVVEQASELYRAEVGYPIGYFHTYKTDGVFQNQSEIDAWLAAGKPGYRDNPQPGDLKVLDLNGDGVLNQDDDKTMTGDPNPHFTAGLNISINYKGFDFGLSGYGMFGHQIFRAWRQYGHRPYQNYTTEVYDYWHGAGTSNTLPILYASNSLDLNTDMFIENGDFFKFQTVTLGYDFTRLWKTSPFSQLRFYVQAQNLFTITGYKGMDPEVGTSSGFSSWAKGIDLGFYPQPRTILVGLNIKF